MNQDNQYVLQLRQTLLRLKGSIFQYQIADREGRTQYLPLMLNEFWREAAGLLLLEESY